MTDLARPPFRSSASSASSVGLAVPAVGGYRLDELIGIGETANVYAGALDVGRPGGADPRGSDRVVVKLCLPPPGRRASGRGSARAGPGGDVGFGREAECRALALRPIAAMPRLLDVATTESGELVLVMTLCPGRPLGSPASRSAHQALDEGLLLGLVQELHGGGLAHGGLDPGAVLIDHDGALSLVGFRSARFASDPGFGEAIGADLRAVSALARDRPTVISFSTEFSAGEVGPEVGSRERSRVDDTLADDTPADAWRWADDTIEEPARELAFLETLEPAVLAIRESGAALRGLVRTRSIGATAPRRRRLLAAGGALVVGAAVVGCLLVPSGGTPSADAGEAHPRGGATSTAPSTDQTVIGSAQADVQSDDAVRAVSALLELRRECLGQRDPGCLDAVDQWNAPAMLGDRELVRGSGPPDDPLASVTAVTLVERLGATALLSGTTGDDTGDPGTTKPVSLLVVRSETGWRLRSYRVGQGPP